MKKKIPTERDLKKLDVESWGTWTKEVSEFDWSYDDTETINTSYSIFLYQSNPIKKAK